MEAGRHYPHLPFPGDAAGAGVGGTLFTQLSSHAPGSSSLQMETSLNGTLSDLCPGPTVTFLSGTFLQQQ